MKIFDTAPIIENLWQKYTTAGTENSFFEWLSMNEPRINWMQYHDKFYLDWLKSDDNEFSGEHFYKWLLTAELY